MSEEAAVHVVIGAGQVGVQVAEKLVARGERVRVVRRGEGPAVEGATLVRGDVRDRQFAETATRDARVVYQCAVPPYDRWFEELPELVTGVLHGARLAGARLVVLDNLYMYGAVGPDPFGEDTPIRPISRKGALRARIADELLLAHRRGELQVTIGRASDFIGPRTTIAIVFHEDFYRRTVSGQPAQLIGDPEQPHSYSYTPDVADALVTLGAHDEAVGRVWHLPVLARSSTLALVQRVQRALGAPARHELVSDDTLAQLGERNGIFAEIVEMTYQYKAPFIVDDSRSRASLALRSTPIDDAVEATARWARDTFADTCQAAPIRRV
jgi:nucleoside-diphosphate-sugar epimerase